MESYEPENSYPDEYFAYLRAYANQVMFDSEKLEKEISEISSLVEAIDFAITTTDDEESENEENLPLQNAPMTSTLLN